MKNLLLSFLLFCATSSLAQTTGVYTTSPNQLSNVVGTATNDSACTGCVGEILESNLLAASRITFGGSGVTANVTNISLTAGQWFICGAGVITGGATVSFTYWRFGINTVSATMPLWDKQAQISYASGTAALNGGNLALAVPCFIAQLSTTVIYYLVAEAGYTVATPEAYGRITATRMR